MLKYENSNIQKVKRIWRIFKKNMISAEIVVRVVKNEKQTKGLPKQLCNNQ